MNSGKTMFINFNQDANISSFNGKPLKFDQFIYFGSNMSSIESNVNIYIEKPWTVIDRLMTLWKSDHSDETEQVLFQVLAVSVLLYGCNNWT